MTFIKAYSSVRDDVVDQLSANSDVPYRATLAEAVAEFPVGFYFKSDDKGGVGPYPGELWIYKRTSGGYEPQIAGNDAQVQEAVDQALAASEAAEQAAQDAQEAVAEVSSQIDTRAPIASTTVAVAALPTTQQVYLATKGREGFFAWQVGNFSDKITADPLQGIWIASSLDPTGTLGAWRRVYTEGEADPEWFGAFANNNNNDTPAFQAALAVDPGLQLRAKNYRIADLVLPTGCTLTGVRGFTNLYRFSGASCILDIRGKGSIRIQNLAIRGVGRTADGISGGGDGLSCNNLTINECRYGVGDNRVANGGYQATSSFINVVVTGCTVGYASLIDSKLIAGTVGNCISHGISFSAGANDNAVLGTKIEFNAGVGIRITSSRNNTLMPSVVDRCGLAGIRLFDCDDHFVQTVMRRNGRIIGTANDDRCHLYHEACRGLSVNIQTSAGNEDNGTGDVTPLYSVRVGGGANSCTGYTLLGDVAGCTGTTNHQEQTVGAVSATAVMLATGLGERRIAYSNFLDGLMYQGRIPNGTQLPAGGTVALSFTRLPSLDFTQSLTYLLTLTVRNRTTLARSSGHVVITVSRDGGDSYLTIGNLVSDQGTEGFDGNVTISASSVTAGATSLFVTLASSGANTFDVSGNIVRTS